MIRRPPRSTQSRSSAASDVYKRQGRTTTRLDCTPALSDGGAWNGKDGRHRLRNPGRSLIRDISRGRAPAVGPALLAVGCSGLLGISLQLRVNQSLAAPHADDRHPVSYTHLRAQETDSYLVCRLLLEKKK